MKTITLLFVLAASKLFAGSSDLRFLKAIAEVETGNRPNAIGASGEISAYQIMPHNWRRHTNRDVSEARRPAVAQLVALRHLEWTRRQLRHARPELLPDQYNNPFLLAVAWRWGPNGTRPLTQEKIEYATRVRNLMQ